MRELEETELIRYQRLCVLYWVQVLYEIEFISSIYIYMLLWCSYAIYMAHLSECMRTNATS